MQGDELFSPVPPEDIAAADEQIRQYQREIRYDTRDFPVEVIVSRYKNSNFFIPNYQREFIWDDNDQSSFIESVLMGLPISMMFLAEDDEEGTFEIVDGVQRIKTLERFSAGDLRLQNLEKLTKLIGFRFSDLPELQRNRFMNRPLRIVILDHDTTYESRKDLFDRINKSGRRLEPSERRRGALAGPFMEFLEKCAENKQFRTLCPVSRNMLNRKEPLELVTRFFAYSEEYTAFEHDVEAFLDDFVMRHQQQFDRDRFVDEFQRAMDFVHRFFPYGFAKSPRAKTTPRVRFEAIAVGVNLALRDSPDLVPKPVTPWLESDQFKQHVTTHASNSAPRLSGRIQFVRDKLLETE